MVSVRKIMTEIFALPEERLDDLDKFISQINNDVHSISKDNDIMQFAGIFKDLSKDDSNKLD